MFVAAVVDDVICGLDIMQKYRLKLDIQGKTMNFID